MRTFMRFVFYLLYHPFAFAYDLVAAAVSLGRWKKWVLSVVPFLEGNQILEIGHGPGHLQSALLGQDPSLKLRAGLIAQILLARPGDQAGAERDAGALMALIDGLIFNIVVGQLDADTATEILRGQLDYIFSGATWST